MSDSAISALESRLKRLCPTGALNRARITMTYSILNYFITQNQNMSIKPGSLIESLITMPNGSTYPSKLPLVCSSDKLGVTFNSILHLVRERLPNPGDATDPDHLSIYVYGKLITRSNPFIASQGDTVLINVHLKLLGGGKGATKKLKKEVSKLTSATTAVAKAMKRSAAVKQPKNLKPSLPAEAVKEIKEDWKEAKALTKALYQPFQYIPKAFGTSAGSTVFTNTISYDDTIDVGGCAATGIIPRGQAFATYNHSITTGGAGTWGYVPGYGDISLGSGYQSGRILAMGLRWHFRVSADTVPGFVYAGLIGGIKQTSDYSTLSVSSLTQMDGFCIFNGDKAGDGEVTWRPVDAYEGQFSTYAVSNSTFASTNFPMAVFTGWPAGTNIKVDYIVHIEVMPKPTFYNGLPSTLKFSEESYDEILAYAKHVGNQLWPLVVAVGPKVLSFMASRMIGDLRTINTMLNRSQVKNRNTLPSMQPVQPPELDKGSDEPWPVHDELAPNPLAPSIMPVGLIPFPPEGWMSYLAVQDLTPVKELTARLNALEAQLRKTRLVLGPSQVEAASSSSGSRGPRYVVVDSGHDSSRDISPTMRTSRSHK
jgi:hypothetical protein